MYDGELVDGSEGQEPKKKKEEGLVHTARAFVPRCPRVDPKTA
jgi:hypothetical protein